MYLCITHSNPLPDMNGTQESVHISKLFPISGVKLHARSAAGEIIKGVFIRGVLMSFDCTLVCVTYINGWRLGSNLGLEQFDDGLAVLYLSLQFLRRSLAVVDGQRLVCLALLLQHVPHGLEGQLLHLPRCRYLHSRILHRWF